VGRAEDMTRDERVTTGRAPKTEGNSPLLMQVNWRSIVNKAVDCSNIIDTYNPLVVIGTESWLIEAVSNVEIFRDEYTAFRGYSNN
jgi:hypothetical protein